MMFSWCCYYRLLSVPEKLRIELKKKLGLLIKIKTNKKFLSVHRLFSFVGSKAELRVWDPGNHAFFGLVVCF